MTVCVFASSSDAAAPAFREAAAEMGRLIARAGHAMAFGGGDVGLMGDAARAASAEGGWVIGVIVGFMDREGVSYRESGRLEVTETMAQRKARLEEMSDAFVALPGGFGTLEELAEVIALCQLGLMAKPIAVLNTGGFYDGLAAFFERIFRERFSKEAFRSLVRFLATPAEVISYLASWRPGSLPRKWF